MIKYIQPVANESFQPIYKQIQRDFGLIGDIFHMHSPSPALFAAVWAALRETQLVGAVPRDMKEAVALAVSKRNECPFCVDAHSTLLAAAGNKAVAKKIKENAVHEIKDANRRAIIEWTLETRSPGSPGLIRRPFSEQEAPEIIGTVVINNYINRMMDVLQHPTSIPKNAFLKAVFMKAGAVYLSSTVRRRKQPGESLRFLPEALLPDNLRWARPHSAISRAFACLSVAANAAGESALDPNARMVVQRYLAHWDGKDPGLSRQWAEHAVERLSGASRTAAKLALLTAIAPYQVDEELIRLFRMAYPEDVQLLHLLSWSSFTAACQIGTWCMLPDEH
ncbi:carboxymuconolactone decarboxylase family protein [Cohnella sp. REN36]|uniref:carboxymuconolactone decarboxylase family protein n=1 Tax=Cohnella sp. REN36 TaxID=2887347 RepID=UPI001D157762|nr:carboxymuconolactone decarboxylase family protein [Cohnella sp. REN36]MCC3372065.1 carboxymuconolactone decarboxylase family protein [Cohnella sp. REN36]